MYYLPTLFHLLVNKNSKSNQQDPINDINYQVDHKGQSIEKKDAPNLNLSSSASAHDSHDPDNL